MRCLALALLVSVMGEAAWADGAPTHIAWHEWKVCSSEDFNSGMTHHGYPLMSLFDGNPRTAWVHSAKGSWPADLPKHWIEISSRKQLAVDGIWIMNGYNKSASVFRRNNRVTRIAIWSGRQKLKETQLTDRMGWHRVRLPVVSLTQAPLRIEFLDVKRGRDNDLCISEIALWSNERRVPMKLPAVFTYFRGPD